MLNFILSHGPVLLLPFITKGIPLAVSNILRFDSVVFPVPGGNKLALLINPVGNTTFLILGIELFYPIFSQSTICNAP